MAVVVAGYFLNHWAPRESVVVVEGESVAVVVAEVLVRVAPKEVQEVARVLFVAVLPEVVSRRRS